MTETLKFIGSIDRIRFKANDSSFKIATMRISKVLEGMPRQNDYGDVIFKGNMTMIPSDNYVIQGILVDDKRYGPQYNLKFSRREKPIEKMSKQDFRKFLTTISSKWGPIINKEFDDSRKIFASKDKKKLMQIDGIGSVIAGKLFDKYESQKDYSAAYVEFAKWGFTTKATLRVISNYSSVEEAISVLNSNPYDLIKVSGMGFKTIDKKALATGVSENDPRRVRAFVMDYFEKCAMDGSSWVSSEQLKKYLAREIFHCDIKGTFNWIHDSKAFVVLNIDNEIRISLKELFDSEKLSARELIRINSVESKALNNVDETIKKIEDEQGFKYSDEQMDGIHRMLENQVSLLRGPGGVGKTSCLNAVVKVLKNNKLSIATCALAGKAADNLRQITGNEGRTIHSLLGINEVGSCYNSAKKLPFDVIIVDELSMVNVNLFARLVEAIRTGAKLIMVGDSAQLDAIGVGVMRSIVNSNVIPVITLRKIHRQAQNSAIVTHSLTYRTGKLPQISEKDSWHRLGVNKDLGYVFEDADNEDRIMKDTILVYKQMMKKYDTSSIQILTPMIANCFKLNNKLQEIANPKSDDKKEYEIYPGKEYGYILREGDRVLNTSNNYETVNPNNESETRPIFNGNTGIIKKIDVDKDEKGNVDNVYVVIDFDGVGQVLVDKNGINKIQLGYAMTVHKSQGSTIPCVIIALPFQYMLNSRELLYTALTRASKECYLLTSMKTLKATVKKTSNLVCKNNLDYLLKKQLEAKGEEHEH